MAANKRAKGRLINNQERGGEKKKESQEGASRLSDSLGSSGQSALSWPLQGKGERALWGPPRLPIWRWGGPVAARGRPVRHWRAPGIHFSSRDKMFNEEKRRHEKRREGDAALLVESAQTGRGECLLAPRLTASKPRAAN